MTPPAINPKPPKKNINGILLLDKPLGLSSNAALQRVKRLFNAKKAGHTGSLDPLATGMLPLCFGEATKFSQYLLEANKHYRTIMQLGIRTTTADAEGEILETRGVPEISLEQMTAVLSQFTGEIQQVPPMFSALKVQGKPLYELARKGIEVERKARSVSIYHLACINKISADQFELEVHCSKGTYIRTLVEDIGEALQCGAHVASLRRVSVDPYQQHQMVTLEVLEALMQTSGAQALSSFLLPLESSVQILPAIKLSPSSGFYLRKGQSICVPDLPMSGLVRLYEAESFIGLGEVEEGGRVSPKRLIATQPFFTAAVVA